MMNVSDMRAQLEADILWRLDEIRHLRNLLLQGEEPDKASIYSLRAILVMQYAHLEGFTRTALSLYVDAINSQGLPAKSLRPELLAAALSGEFDALRRGMPSSGDDGKMTSRARHQVAFVQRLQELNEGPISIAAEVAVSMEMNLGSDVLKKCLVALGISVEKVKRDQYTAIDFVKNVRNDIAHGGRKEKIPGGLFSAHLKKCEEFMNELARVLTRALSEKWFLAKVKSETTGTA
ncbi:MULTISPECIES: MAE_28990/MAE_18760 family HEPN-like nuclease [unclassified Streptomyces]|uniref:MAE_28990/MAE_18760 family HEPN-like nuclease n=1 Tax=unclassified Streptomyces TaxID=2593676 RepID=UPI0033319D3F